MHWWHVMETRLRSEPSGANNSSLWLTDHWPFDVFVAVPEAEVLIKAIRRLRLNMNYHGFKEKTKTILLIIILFETWMKAAHLPCRSKITLQMSRSIKPLPSFWQDNFFWQLRNPWKNCHMFFCSWMRIPVKCLFPAHNRASSPFPTGSWLYSYYSYPPQRILRMHTDHCAIRSMNR